MASKRYLLVEWSEINCRTYLQAYGINNLGYQKFISNCKNMKSIEMINKQNTNDTAVHLIRNQATKKPSLFETLKGGPYWSSNVNFKRFIDAIMHVDILLYGNNIPTPKIGEYTIYFFILLHSIH